MNKQWSVGMLVFDQVDAFDYVGPSEILSIARYTAEDVQNMKTGEAVTASNGLRIMADYSMENAPHVDILLIPGGFFPAQAGLLNGKKATTNRKALDFLQQYFPDVTVIRDQKFVGEGDVITSQGPDAGLHLTFHLIKRLMGEEAARMAADTLEYDGIYL